MSTALHTALAKISDPAHSRIGAPVAASLAMRIRNVLLLSALVFVAFSTSGDLAASAPTHQSARPKKRLPGRSSNLRDAQGRFTELSLDTATAEQIASATGIHTSLSTAIVAVREVAWGGKLQLALLDSIPGMTAEAKTKLIRRSAPVELEVAIGSYRPLAMKELVASVNGGQFGREIYRSDRPDDRMLVPGRRPR